jgi:hypothetical protein
MTPTETARELLASIAAPRGAVSIFAEPEPVTGFVLRVWVAANATVCNIPTKFQGHPVIVQNAPRVSPDY